MTDSLGTLGTLAPNDPVDGDPDKYHHKWSNYCLYCHKENYEPAALHGLRLWHYCKDCVMVCRECHQEKPIYSFAYDFESEAYKQWKIVIKAGGNVLQQWKKISATNMGHALKDAHTNICNHCDVGAREERERIEREEATKNKQLAIDKHNNMMAAASTQAALSAILDSLE